MLDNGHVGRGLLLGISHVCAGLPMKKGGGMRYVPVRTVGEVCEVFIAGLMPYVVRFLYILLQCKGRTIG